MALPKKDPIGLPRKIAKKSSEVTKFDDKKVKGNIPYHKTNSTYTYNKTKGVVNNQSSPKAGEGTVGKANAFGERGKFKNHTANFKGPDLTVRSGGKGVGKLDKITPEMAKKALDNKRRALIRR